RVIQMANAGVATGLVSLPLRYMHTPGEVVDLQVVEQCVKLLVEFAKLIQPGQDFAW
ncbi:MAG: M42 family peptidase, partial [Opitutales bacterium]|nr:M42 family peptidase [Opitutales bacterium]